MAARDFLLVPGVGKQLLHHFAAVLRHRIDQTARQEHRRFAMPERHRLAASLLQHGQEARVLRL